MKNVNKHSLEGNGRLAKMLAICFVKNRLDQLHFISLRSPFSYRITIVTQVNKHYIGDNDSLSMFLYTMLSINQIILYCQSFIYKGNLIASIAHISHAIHNHILKFLTLPCKKTKDDMITICSLKLRACNGCQKRKLFLWSHLR